MLIQFFQKIGFVPTNGDLYIFTYCQDDIFIIVTVYIDDLAFISQNQTGLDWLKSQLIQKFNIKDLDKIRSIIG